MTKRKDEDDDFLVKEEPTRRESREPEVDASGPLEALVEKKLSEPVNMYMSGRRVSCEEQHKLKYENLLKELGEAQKGRDLQDIPPGDPFFTKKQELDTFVASI